MASELVRHPPPNVRYEFLKPIDRPKRWIKSPIKGFMREYESIDCDLIEAILSPIQNDRDWILSLSNFHEAVAFNLRGVPLPRAIRFAYIQRLLLRSNCKKILSGARQALTHCMSTDVCSIRG